MSKEATRELVWGVSLWIVTIALAVVLAVAVAPHLQTKAAEDPSLVKPNNYWFDPAGI